MKHILALASALSLALVSPVLAAKPATPGAQPQTKAAALAKLAAATQATTQQLVGTCAAGQVAPGRSASAPGSPFNPTGKARASSNANFTNACKEQAASP